MSGPQERSGKVTSHKAGDCGGAKVCVRCRAEGEREGKPIHDYQHVLIEERAAALAAIPTRMHRADEVRRRDARMRLAATIQGHLMGQHGWTHHYGPPLSVEALTETHRLAHEPVQSPDRAD